MRRAVSRRGDRRRTRPDPMMVPLGWTGATAKLSCAMVLLFGLVGCTSGRKDPATPSGAKPDQHQEIDALTTVVSPHEAVDTDELLARAEKKLKREDFVGAQTDYQLVLDHASDQESRQKGLLGLATALDLGGRPADALSAYARFVTQAPLGKQREAIRVRKVRLLLYFERYEEAGRESEQMNLEDHGVLAQVVLIAARAHSEVARGNLDTAERILVRGRAIVDAHSLDRGSAPPLDVAALFLALGDLHRVRAEAISFDPIPADFPRLLEERCQLILDAQGAYSEVMRSMDAHYSSMAGVKVGSLYHDLHSDLTSMPKPKEANTEERQKLFEGALRLRYSILLRKSVAMLRATVALLEKNKQPSPWRKKAEEALLQIEDAQRREQEAIDALPYTRQQLQQVLDEMASRAGTRAAADAGQK